MNQPELSAFNYDSVDSWIDSNVKLSAVFDAIVSAHPTIASISARWDFKLNVLTLQLNLPPPARRFGPHLPWILNMSEAFEQAGIEPEQARSLSSCTDLALPFVKAGIAPSHDWLCTMGQSIGLGYSATFSTHDDDIDRASPQALELLERSCSDTHTMCPELATACLLAGSRFLHPESANACSALTAEFEAAELTREPLPAFMATLHRASKTRL